jgi:hypothetical protein
MNEILQRIRYLIQEDIGNRGLAKDPAANLLSECPDDFAEACQSIAETAEPALAVVTGFFIPQAKLGESDGPPGALFLARALTPLGVKIILVSDEFCQNALAAGLEACRLEREVGLITLPSPAQANSMNAAEYVNEFTNRSGQLTHLIALERSGPNYEDRCCTMRGLDITEQMSPAHFLFEAAAGEGITTIGIGDGGNEIGMGEIARNIIGRNIPRGDLVACRVPTDYLIVCGISNWGAYGLAAGVRLLRGQTNARELFDPEKERHLLQIMVERGPLVDGVSGQRTATVDGIDFERYGEKLRQLAAV